MPQTIDPGIGLTQNRLLVLAVVTAEATRERKRRCRLAGTEVLGMKAILQLGASAACLFVTSCALPGKQDLADKAYVETVIVARSHRQLAECVTRILDDEPPIRWGELQTPVTRSISSADGNTIDLQGGWPTATTTLLWTATFTNIGPN